ncbi:MAG TPA: hypothetical protein PLC81_08355 [Bacteroidales bacterium]|nr:hypothetical protein [Bacteroidales bacterium]HQK37634.1 hypothetical protein [Bacteroidales bacterium]
MKVFSNEYVRVDYQEPVRLLETVWMPRSSELTEEGVFREMNRFLEFLTDYSPLRIIADTRYFGVGVTPHLQSWIVLNFMAKIMEAGVKKYAIIVSAEKYEQLNADLSTDENDEELLIRYFTDYNAAFRWVCQQ